MENVTMQKMVKSGEAVDVSIFPEEPGGHYLLPKKDILC